MKIIEQGYEILDLPNKGISILEVAGRTCYQSQDKITPESSEKFVKMLKDRGHHAMLEFGNITVKFKTNRGVTHELVRHRMCSFAQESTRYVRYDGTMEFIRPVWTNPILSENKFDNITIAELIWATSMRKAEEDYKKLLNNKWRPEQARELLPNSLKTEIVVMANLREWGHIFDLRCSTKAHPQMSSLMIPLRDELRTILPVIFDS